MSVDAIQGRHPSRVVQFSVFMPNQLGRLHEMVGLLASHNVHILALSVVDTTDSAIVRVVLDDPDQTAELFRKHSYPFTMGELVVVEVNSPDELNRLMSALLEAELNINYLYSFIPHPHGKSAIGLGMEDNDMAEEVLKRHQFPVLRQADLSR